MWKARNDTINKGSIMKKTLLLSSLLMSGLLTGPAQAEVDNDALMKQLKQMQAKMEQMQSEMNKLKSELNKTKTQSAKSERIVADIKKDVKSGKVKIVEEAPAVKAPENDVKISMVPAPKFETADGAYSFKIGGFAQIDAGAFGDDKRDQPDGTQIRRGRLNVSGTIARDWNYKFENDFGLNNSVITDAFVEYAGLAPVTITVGQFKEPFGLEELTSDLFVTFMERASNVAFAPDRQLGAMVSTRGEAPYIGNWTAALGGFGANSSVSSTDDESKDAAARVTFAPFAAPTEVLHFGASAAYRKPDRASNTYTVSSRPETRLTNTLLSINTGTISNVDNVNLLGLEAAAVYGPFSVQSEYMVSDVERENGFSNQKFDGYYVEASYFLTGESRAYNAKKGIFDRVKPQSNFNPAAGNWGAWQVAARYSDLDLNDTVIKGGDMKNWTLGLRWIPHPNLSFMLNYVKVNTDSHGTVADDDPDVYMMRAQFDF